MWKSFYFTARYWAAAFFGKAGAATQDVEIIATLELCPSVLCTTDARPSIIATEELSPSIIGRLEMRP